MGDQQQLLLNQQKVKTNILNRLSSGQVVTLVAVTKTVNAQVIEQLYENGIRHFGENRTNHLIEKQDQLRHLSEAVWHFIGRLQTRQVKSIINRVDYIHSLDRIELAEEIEKRADRIVNCFIQVNVSGESSKAGFSPSQVYDLIESMSYYKKIRVVGLMTMAPFDAEEKELREYFSTLKELQEQIMEEEWVHAPCTELSMGMSGDYEIAVEEGATFVRVGTALFEGVS